MKWHKDCLPKNLWATAKKIEPSASRQQAILAGGTALALRLGHRISVDLDFFCTTAIKHEKILREVDKAIETPHVLLEDPESLVIQAAGAKISFFQHEKKFQDPDLLDGIAIASLQDIAAMKLIAISQRGLKRDFVDLYSILTIMPFFKIAEHACCRYGAARINPIIIGKALAYFTDAEGEPDPAYPPKRAIAWKTVRAFFQKHVRQLVLDLEAARE